MYSLEILAARYAYRAYKEVDFYEAKTDTQVFSREVGKILVIAYRGSDHFIDWINNFCIQTTAVTPYKEEGTDYEIKVHQGMLKSYLPTREFIQKIVSNSSCDRVLFTGHSLGGALAAAAALDCQYNLGISPTVIQFGSPDFGNEYFAQSYNQRVPDTTNIINPYDIVPRLPMRLLGYVAIGKRKEVSLPWVKISHFPFIDPHYASKYLSRL